MLRETGKRITVCVILVILVVTATVGLTAWSPATAAQAPPKPLKSGVVSFDDAPARQADWGEMRRYFTGETAGTKDVLTAVAIVQPSKAVHRAHRHAQEEYLILVEGSGTWSLDGRGQHRSQLVGSQPRLGRAAAEGRRNPRVHADREHPGRKALLRRSFDAASNRSGVGNAAEVDVR